MPKTKTEVVGDGGGLSTDEMPIGDTKVNAGQSHSSTTASAPFPEPTTLTKIRHEWYQNAQSVSITIYAKGVQKDQAEVDIRDDSVGACICLTKQNLTCGLRFTSHFHTRQTGPHPSYSRLTLCLPLSTRPSRHIRLCRRKLKSIYVRRCLGKSGRRLKVASLSRMWN